MCLTTPELIAVVKDLVLAIAAATTAVVAVLGLKRWQAELHGKAHFEAARDLMRATYRLRNEIQIARSPLVRSTEFPDGYEFGPSKNQRPEDEAAAYTHVFSERWAPVIQAMQEFDAGALEAEALWGRGVRQKTGEIRALVRRFRAATESFIANSAGGGEDFASDRQYGKKIRSEVFETGSENEFSAEINQKVDSIEKFLRPHLRRA